jgi:hypothetical protein
MATYSQGLEKLRFMHAAKAVRLLICLVERVGEVHHAHRVRAVSKSIRMPKLMDCFLRCSLTEALRVGRTAPEFGSQARKSDHRDPATNVCLPEDEVEPWRKEVCVCHAEHALGLSRQRRQLIENGVGAKLPSRRIESGRRDWQMIPGDLDGPAGEPRLDTLDKLAKERVRYLANWHKLDRLPPAYPHLTHPRVTMPMTMTRIVAYLTSSWVSLERWQGLSNHLDDIETGLRIEEIWRCVPSTGLKSQITQIVQPETAPLSTALQARPATASELIGEDMINTALGTERVRAEEALLTVVARDHLLPGADGFSEKLAGVHSGGPPLCASGFRNAGSARLHSDVIRCPRSGVSVSHMCSSG